MKEGQKQGEKLTKTSIKNAIAHGRDRPNLMESYDKKAESENFVAVGKVMRLVSVLIKSGLKEEDAETHLKKD